MYLLLDSNKRVKEIIPEFDDRFPGISINERYPSEFVNKLIAVDDSTKVYEGYRYNEETMVWEYANAPTTEYVSSSDYTIEQKLIDIEERLAESDEVAIDLYESILNLSKTMEAMNNG